MQIRKWNSVSPPSPPVSHPLLPEDNNYLTTLTLNCWPFAGLCVSGITELVLFPGSVSSLPAFDLCGSNS